MPSGHPWSRKLRASDVGYLESFDRACDDPAEGRRDTLGGDVLLKPGMQGGVAGDDADIAGVALVAAAARRDADRSTVTVSPVSVIGSRLMAALLDGAHPGPTGPANSRTVLPSVAPIDVAEAVHSSRGKRGQACQRCQNGA